MGSVDLERYVSRLTGILKACPPASRSKTVSWVLRPLLDELGWDHDAGRSAGPIGLLESDLVLPVGTDPPTPALLVAAEAADGALSEDRIESIETAMTSTGIDRALYANGRSFLLLAGTGEDRLRVSAPDLPSQGSEMALYSRSVLRTHCEELDPQVRAFRRLTAFRTELIDSVVSLLEETAGTAAAPEERVIAAFLDAAAETLVGSSDTAETSGPDAGFVDGPPSEPGAATASDRSAEGSSETPTAAQDSDDPNAAGKAATSIPASVPPDADPEGEYVVRVFNERGSVGAVGHSTSAGALAEATSYFFERGLSGIRVPWAPADGSVVINDRPVDEAGERWDAFEQLPNGRYVNTGGSVSERASRVEALADRAGLRVMLSGDWSGPDR